MNNHRLLSRRTTFSALGLVATTLLAGAAFAQVDGGGAPPPPGGAGAPGGGAGGGGRRGGGQRGGQRPLTVSQVPVDGLDAELTLTADQKTKIGAILKPVEDLRASLAPKPGERPDREKMQSLRTAQEKADTDITALLTPDQTTKLPDVLKEVQGLQAAGIPPGVLGALALTADEKTTIVDIGSKAQRRMRTAMQDAQGDQQAMMEAFQKSRADTKEKVEAALTPAQKTTYDAYMAAHPQPAMGGFGGGRRGGGGGAGAPGGPPPA